jgi:alpha-D-ribose 1-methylphosphonate 5-triphosphate synthase subunit PhnL
MTDHAIRIRGLSKSFTLHHQGGVRLPVLDAVDLDVAPGEAVVLHGPSGAGKSSLLRCLYGNYLADAGSIEVRAASGAWVDVAGADARRILALRRDTLGYVSQFLRAIPRVPAERVVAQPAIDAGLAAGDALDRARGLLARLNLPERLWRLPPATFSGGEQQRVNVARSFVLDYPVLLLDEPTASLDPANRGVVVDLVASARQRGAAVVGIFHDADTRAAVATRCFELPGRAEAA